VFGRENIGVWLYDDLRDDPAGLVSNVFAFLGVDNSFVPDDSSRHKSAGVPESSIARCGECDGHGGKDF
jgi:hypothetical protein